MGLRRFSHETNRPDRVHLQTVDRNYHGKGAVEAVRFYHDLKKNRPDDYNYAEPELNTLGYQLMNRDMLDEAIEILKLNIEAFPESGNVYDSMGEIYMKTGNKSLAIKNYQKSLELDPGNDNARQMIEKMRSE